MSFSHTAVRTLMPLLARLVLALAFIPAGWAMMMGQDQVYSGREAHILRQIGIGPETQAQATAPASGVLAYAQNEPGVVPPPPPEPDPQPAPALVDPPAPQAPAPDPTPILDDPEPTPDPAPEPAPDTVTAKPMYATAVSLVEAGLGPPDLPAWIPIWLARINAFLQLVGAGLLAVGMFSRLWSAGLLVIIAASFYPHAPELIGAIGLHSLPPEQFQLLFSHVALIVLALGLTLTGAGGLSVDRIIFSNEDLDDPML